MSSKSTRDQARDTIAASDFFDAEWYVATYPDVAELGVDPALHYLLIGAALGRNPSQRFDAAAYCAEYPDIGEENPLLHFLRVGHAAGYRPQQGHLDVDHDLQPPRPAEPGQTSHLPAALQRKRAAFDALPWPEDKTRSYRLTRAFLDPAFYIARHFDMAQMGPNFDFSAHFLRAGAREGRSPSPHFSLKHYRQRYGKELQDKGNLFEHWVTEGRKEGRIAHELPEFEAISEILGEEPAACQDKMIALTSDLRARLEFGKLGEMVNKAAALDPLISQTWRQALSPNVQPFHSQKSATRLQIIYALQKAAEFRRAKAVVCVNAPRWGSNRRLEGHLAHALSEIHGPENVILMNTDSAGEMPPNKAPEGVRRIDFAKLTETAKPPEEKQRLLLEFLRSLRPDDVFNVNSRLLWQTLGTYGPILAQDAPVVGCFFCNDQSLFGTWGGYPASQFYRTLPVLKAVCTDSHDLRTALIEQFAVPPDRQDDLHVLESPVDADLPTAPAPQQASNRRAQVFWAGRLDQQKRIDIVYDIARALPDIDIRLWGATVAGGAPTEHNQPENVVLEGAYEDFAKLPFEECDLWLYTSEWDGVPSMLLEVAMTGIPIVGSDVGGTSEVLHADLSYPIAPFDDVNLYADAIRRILQTPDLARENAQKLRDRLTAQRTEAHYVEAVRAVLKSGAEAKEPPLQEAPPVAKLRTSG